MAEVSDLEAFYKELGSVTVLTCSEYGRKLLRGWCSSVSEVCEGDGVVGRIAEVCWLSLE